MNQGNWGWICHCLSQSYCFGYMTKFDSITSKRRWEFRRTKIELSFSTFTTWSTEQQQRFYSKVPVTGLNNTVVSFQYVWYLGARRSFPIGRLGWRFVFENMYHRRDSTPSPSLIKTGFKGSSPSFGEEALSLKYLIMLHCPYVNSSFLSQGSHLLSGSLAFCLCNPAFLGATGITCQYSSPYCHTYATQHHAK